MLRKWLLATAISVSAIAGGNGASFAKQQDQGGPIDQTYGVKGGTLDPYYGDINPFSDVGPGYENYGKASPFWGNVTPAWGDINPFAKTDQPFYGNTDPFWGTVNPYGNGQFLPTVFPYWQANGPQWGGINVLWTDIENGHSLNVLQLLLELTDFTLETVTFWGAEITQILTDLLTKFQIDLNILLLPLVDAEHRSGFYLNLYDRTMEDTKLDHVDWWMASTHWSPQLVQAAVPGGTTIGVLDAYNTRNYSDIRNFKFIGGNQSYVNDHGPASGSLMAAMEDNTGVMGAAPNSNVRVYNPFDATGATGAREITKGMLKLYDQHATVMNASMGTAGQTLSNEWADVLASASLSDKNHNYVLVKAAGNDGTAQIQNIKWPAGATLPGNVILVGSSTPSNGISRFSNTPGEACILVNNACQEQNKLKYRYLVAPGELILVQDNQGSSTRMTGTSYAAPQVSGTVALLQTRWPQLKQYADETVQIVLQSATDLGDPGVDPVYGWGMLNVEGAMSPLNMDNLIVFQPFTYNGKNVNADRNNPNWTPAALKAAIQTPGQLQQWEQQGAFLVVFENVGYTWRDFIIPLSSTLINKTQAVNHDKHPFQAYIYQRLLDWAQGTKAKHRPHRPHMHKR
ncbi:MAG TPA: S8 family serine peptidase [Rhizomicrobium sp.]|jgi:subtilisin family serine protease|nr:S8 family serine peptidase [Rhizomicrobium sp.]